jgi:ankyrin
MLGENAMHVAAKKGHEELVIQLLNSGAGIDELTASGDTVLMMASENGLEKATRLLLNHEVVNHQIELQEQSWVEETEARYEVMCERSGKRGCCIVYVGKLSFKHEKRASPRLNICHVNPAVSVDEDGYPCSGSALLRPASNGHFKVVEQLLQAGARTNAANSLGLYPLDVAKQNGHDSVVDLLRSYGESYPFVW